MRIDFLRLLAHALPGLLPSGHAVAPGIIYRVVHDGESALGIPVHLAESLIEKQIAEAVAAEEAALVAKLGADLIEAVQDRIHPDVAPPLVGASRSDGTGRDEAPNSAPRPATMTAATTPTTIVELSATPVLSVAPGEVAPVDGAALAAPSAIEAEAASLTPAQAVAAQIPPEPAQPSAESEPAQPSAEAVG